MNTKIIRLLSNADWRLYAAVFLLLLLLYLPAMLVGLALDDHLFHMTVNGKFYTGGSSPFHIYTFFPGDPNQLRAMMDTGILPPWWSDLTLKIHFFRPLSSLTLWLDHGMHLPIWLQHVHSLGWYVALLGALALFYRSIFTDVGNDTTRIVVATGVLALVLYALDDAHGLTVAWLANRHSIIATTFGLLALWRHERYMRGLGPAWQGPALFMVALCAGETALAMLGYFLLRTWKTPKKLCPYVVIVICALGLYKMGGYGTQGSGTYVNPLELPLEFMSAVLLRWPTLIGAQLGLVSSNIWLSVPTTSWLRPAIALSGFLLLSIVLYAIRPWHSHELWLFGGALLSLVPMCSIFPHDRLLLVAGIGIAPIVARYLLQGSRGAFWWFMFLTHIVLAVVMLPVQIQVSGNYIEKANNAIQQSPQPPNGGRQTVIVNGPSLALGPLYAPTSFSMEQTGASEWLFLISMAHSSHVVTRVDRYTVDVEAAFFTTVFERTFRSKRKPFSVGDEIRMARVTVQILAVDPKGSPRRVRFVFSDDPSRLHWLYWKDDRYQVFTLPEVGEQVEIPEPESYPLL